MGILGKAILGAVIGAATEAVSQAVNKAKEEKTTSQYSLNSYRVNRNWQAPIRCSADEYSRARYHRECNKLFDDIRTAKLMRGHVSNWEFEEERGSIAKRINVIANNMPCICPECQRWLNEANRAYWAALA